MAKKKRADRFFTKKENKQITDMIWLAQLDLHAVEYVVNYVQTTRDEEADENGERLVSATILVHPKYLQAEITFPPCVRKEFRKDLDGFRKIVYHEVAHIIIDPMYLDQIDRLSPIEKEYWNILREQAVEKVGRIGRWKREIHNDYEALKKKTEGGDK